MLKNDLSADELSGDDLFEDFLATLPRVGAMIAPSAASTASPISAPVSVLQAAHPVLRRV